MGWVASQGHTHHQEGWVARPGNVCRALVLIGPIGSPAGERGAGDAYGDTEMVGTCGPTLM